MCIYKDIYTHIYIYKYLCAEVSLSVNFEKHKVFYSLWKKKPVLEPLTDSYSSINKCCC